MGAVMDFMAKRVAKYRIALASRIETTDHRCAQEHGISQPRSHNSHNIKKYNADDKNTKKKRVFAISDTQYVCIFNG